MGRSIEEKKPLHDLEIEIFGVSHEMIGAYLLDWWELPYAFVESAMFHHNPFDSRIVNNELLYVMNIANHYSKKHVFNVYHNEDVSDEVFDALEINRNDAEVEIKKTIMAMGGLDD